MPDREKCTSDYDGRRTLIIGDVNSGKSHLTEYVLACWVAQTRSKEIAVLDLAPERIDTVGGRLNLPVGFQGAYLATTIVPPRLSAQNEKTADTFAAANAAAIDHLLQDSRLVDPAILIINDVTLYLQAGNYDRLMAVIEPIDTVLINAYYGDSFPDYRISRQERRLSDRLIKECHRVIRLT